MKLFKIAMPFMIIMILVGCTIPTVLTEDDWTRLEKTVKPALSESDWQEFKGNLESRTMTPEEFEMWKSKLSQDIAAIMTGIVDVAPIPEPAKGPINDLVNYGILAAVATFLGKEGGGVVKKAIKKNNGS